MKYVIVVILIWLAFLIFIFINALILVKFVDILERIFFKEEKENDQEETRWI